MLLNFKLKRKKQVQVTRVLEYALLPAVVHIKVSQVFAKISVSSK